MRGIKKVRSFWILSFLTLLFWDASAAAGKWVTVTRVADGDTVELLGGRRVRYIGVNAPEINHELNTAEPFGFEARASNATLVDSRKIRLELDVERYDAYGRTLAYVFLTDQTLVNEKLLQEGLAYFLYKMPNVKYADRLLKAQREAMQARRGIWKDGREKEEGRYVGNRNSRRLHLADCPEVKRVYPRNRVVFATRWDAFWDGYSPSKECLPAFGTATLSPSPWPPPR
jgi:micrococcal nuclease